MAIETQEVIPPQPEQTIPIVRRTDRIIIMTDPGIDPIITALRCKRRAGYVQSQITISRDLSEVADEPFGNTGLTIAQAAQAIGETLDRWATEDREP